ncbi:MAG: UDP-2,3-diacylglucosamine diphosphatase [Acidimicrobiales bacterium]|nr:UDP-2,3-diacylglucosamine diphosphatase [Acidimicrobiales bacterium]
MILSATEQRMVVVSDLHLGSPAAHAEREFGEFLDEVARTGVALCINGDGFDLLQSTSPRLAVSGFPVLQQLQRMVHEGVPVYYVLGNHDVALEHVLFDLHFTVSPFLNLTSGERRIRIEHGHVHDPVYARHPAIYEFGGRIGRFGLLAHADVYALYSAAQRRLDDWRRRSGRSRPYPHHAAALDLFQRGFDVAVFGHTHIPEIIDLGTGTFVNCGDWVTHRTCTIIDQGDLSLHQWEPGLLTA